MADKTSDITSEKSQGPKKLHDFNAKTISKMKYDDIIRLNRNSSKPMDRSWRDESEGVKILNDPSLSRW